MREYFEANSSRHHHIILVVFSDKELVRTANGHPRDVNSVIIRCAFKQEDQIMNAIVAEALE